MIVYVCLWVIYLCIVSSAPAKKEDLPDLIKALNDGKFEHALSLVKESTGINAKDGKGLTPLHLALNIIMDVKGILPNLINALKDKNYEHAISLAKDGVGIKAKNENDATALHLALKDYSMKWNKKEEIVKILLENGADANARDGYNETTPLLYAAEYGTEKMAEELLKHGAKIDGKDSSDWTPLLQAARCGKTEMAKMFMEKGADVFAITKHGDNVLNWAAWSGDNVLVKIFLDKKVDPSLLGSGFTPLMNAASQNREQVVKTLLKDKRVRDTINASNSCHSALSYAERDHFTNIVKMLKDNGAW